MSDAGYHAASDGAGPTVGYLVRLQIAAPESGASDCRARVPLHWARCVSWLGDGTKARTILFRIAEPGRAFGYQASSDMQTRFDAIINSADAAVRASASLTLFRGRYMAEHMLAIPPPVAAHITSELPGFGWAWAFGDQIELWNDAMRASQTDDAAGHLSDSFANPV